MARRLILGHQFSPFAPVSVRDALQKCYCSIFLPGSHQAVPQYMVSSYLSGDIRIHDTQALTLSATDGIAASHMCAFAPSLAPAVQLRTVQTEAGMFLISLGEFGNLYGMRIDDIVADKASDSRIVQPEKIFHLARTTCPNMMSCFALDDIHKRVFTGDVDGVWHCWDMERLTSNLEMLPFQTYRAHQSSIVDGDYMHNLLASASEDGSVCVWDVRSQSCVCAFDPATGKHLPLNQRQRTEQCNNQPSLSVRFDKSGRHVVASSRQERITVWNIRADTSQCCIQTTQIPYFVDTAKDSVFFSSANECVWRYSMYNAQMQCYRTSTFGINHIHIDRELQQTMVVSGVADTVELLSLDGVSLGKAIGKKEPSMPSSPAFNPQSMWSPSLLSEAEEAESFLGSASPRTLEMDELCESGSEIVTDDDGDAYDDDRGSSVYEYSQVNDDMEFSSAGEEEEMPSEFERDEPVNEYLLDRLAGPEMEEEQMEAYPFTSDSDISPRFRYVVPSSPAYYHCDFPSSQDENLTSEEEEDE